MINTDLPPKVIGKEIRILLALAYECCQQQSMPIEPNNQEGALWPVLDTKIRDF